MNSSSKTIATIVYYISFIIMGATTAAIGPSLPALAKNTSSGLQQISLIFVFSALGYLVASYFGGRAYDRIPGHKLTAVILIILGSASALIPIANTLIMLLVFMFFSGFATGLLDVGCNILLLWTHGEKSGPYLNGLHFFFGIGSFTAPLLLAQILLATGSIQWLYWIFAMICLPVAIWFWFLPEPATHIQSDESRSTTLPLIPILLCVLLFFLYVGLELGFGNWVYTYALTLGLGTEITAAYLTSAFWGAFTVGRLLGVWISTRMRAQNILIMDLAGCLVSTLIIMLWKDSTIAMWIGTIGLGLSMASVFPTIFMYAGERMQITGTVTGLFLAGAGIGSMLLPWLIGQVFARTGPATMTTVLLVDIIGIAIVMFLFASQKVVSVSAPQQASTQ